MLNKNTFFFFISFLSLNILGAQNQQNMMPKIIPASPEAALFQRYGEIPIDISTGVPNINIDIYTIKSNKLEIPLKISYHASGIKVQDVASPIGLGWVLSSGMISRTILGKRDGDDLKIQYKTSSEIDAVRGSSSSSSGVQGAIHELLDNQFKYRDYSSDRFFYMLPTGQNEIFRYDFINDNLVKIPYTPTKIIKNETANSDSTKKLSFEIITEDGTKYIFDKSQIYGNHEDWRLDKVISNDRRDTIKYFYSSTFSNAYHSAYITQEANWGDNLVYDGSGFCATDSTVSDLGGEDSQYNSSVNYLYDNTPILERIVSNSTLVKFNYANRSDKGNYRLNNITVFDKNANQLIKEINFDQSYFGTSVDNNLRLRLDKVKIKGKSTEVSQNYAFDYEDIVLPPYSSSNYQLCNEDYWGYYNGKNTPFFVPYEFIDPVARPSAIFPGNRDPDANFAKACMLKTIHYPTGGRTEFVFEPNYCNSCFYYPEFNGNIYSNGPWSWQGSIIGGFRIKSISNYPNSSTSSSIVKTYKYPENPFASTIEPENFVHNQQYVHVFGDPEYHHCWKFEFDAYRTMVSSSSFLPLTVEGQTYIRYSGVEEYIGTETANIGKKVYSYTFQRFYPENSFPSLKYKDTYHYDRGFYKPKLLSEYDYEFKNNEYILVKSTDNIYTEFRNNSFKTGVKFIRTIPYIDRPLGGGSLPILPSDFANYRGSVFYLDMMAYENVELLTKSITIEKMGNSTVENTTEYLYENTNHLQPTKIKTTDSKGSKWITSNYYPLDINSINDLGLNALSASELNAINQLKAENRISEVVQTNYFKDINNNGIGENNELITSNRKGYQIIDNVALLKNHQSLKGTYNATSNPLEDKIQYHSYYPNGNVKEVSKADGTHIVYVWGYNGEYPIAMIENAVYSEVSAYVYDLQLKSNSDTDHCLDTQSCNEKNLRDALNSLRNDPAYRSKWQVNTYTYDPLIGMTSMTDPKGYTVYYEYDSFDRLKQIKGQDGNILSKNEYHYKNQ